MTAPATFDVLGCTIAIEGHSNCCGPLEALLAPFQPAQPAAPGEEPLRLRFFEQGPDRYAAELPLGCTWGTAAEVIRFCEWWLVATALARRDDLYQLHGGCVGRDGGAVLLPGQSGSGKTTLTLGLMARGFVPLADDVILLGEGLAHPFERCFHIDETTAAIVERLGLADRLVGPDELVSGYCRPRSWSPSLPPRLIVWPRYQPEAATSTRRLRPGQAWTMLANQLIAPSGPTEAHFALLRQLVDGVSCWQLVYSEIEEATAAVESLLTMDDP